MRSAVAVLATIVLGMPHVVAQRPDPFESDHRLREWNEVVDGMSPTERLAFLNLSRPEQDRTVGRLARREKDEAAFLLSLKDTVRTEIEALSPGKRRARILELRVGQKLERAVVDAWELGIIDDDSAADALDLSAPAEQAERILELQKAMFIRIHDEHLRRLPPRLRDDIMSLPPRRFFRHGAVNDVRIRHHFAMPAVNSLRRQGSDAIEKLLDALSKGNLDLEQKRWFRPSGLTEFEKLDADGRRRFVAQLRRTHFFRELKYGRREPPRDRGPGPYRDGIELPPELFDRLDPREQKAWLSMPPSAQDAFARRRFPLWWQNEGPDGVRPREHTLRAFIDGLEKLPKAERKQLLDRPLVDGIRRVLGPTSRPRDPRLGPRRRPGDRPPRPGDRPPRPGDRPPLPGDRGPPPRVDLRRLADRLSPEDRARFDRLPERARRPFLRKRFPEEFPPGRR